MFVLLLGDMLQVSDSCFWGLNVPRQALISTSAYLGATILVLWRMASSSTQHNPTTSSHTTLISAVSLSYTPNEKEISSRHLVRLRKKLKSRATVRAEALAKFWKYLVSG